MQLTQSSFEYYKNEVYSLYHLAFPSVERRGWSNLENLVIENPIFNIDIFENEKGFCGFITNWDFSSFIYIEHFAIQESQRGGGIGSKIISSFSEQQTVPIVLEVEQPTTDISKRRIKFYERHGFHIISKIYLQPPYDKVSPYIPMFLMSNNDKFVSQDITAIIKTIYKQVYDVEK